MPDLEVELQTIIADCSNVRVMIRPDEHNRYEKLIRRLAEVSLFQERRIHYLAETAGVEFPASCSPIFAAVPNVDIASPPPAVDASPNADLDEFDSRSHLDMEGESVGEPIASSDLTQESPRRRRARREG